MPLAFAPLGLAFVLTAIWAWHTCGRLKRPRLGSLFKLGIPPGGLNSSADVSGQIISGVWLHAYGSGRMSPGIWL